MIAVTAHRFSSVLVIPFSHLTPPKRSSFLTTVGVSHLGSATTNHMSSSPALVQVVVSSSAFSGRSIINTGTSSFEVL